MPCGQAPQGTFCAGTRILPNRHRLSREVMGMRYYFITFRSVTYAQQGERLLKGSGFRCALQRTPRWMEEQGCGYALKIRAAGIEPAAAMLAERQIPIRKVYLQKPDGQLEEVPHDLS